MAGFLFAFVLILVVIMIVIETVTVRFIYKNEFIIRIDFLLFELILYPSRKGKKRRRRRNLLSGIKRSFARASATKKALEHLLSRSRITVRELDIPRKNEDPAKLALSTQRAYNLISAIITYLSLKTEAVIATASPFVADEATESDTPVSLDVSLSSTLFRVVSSFIIFFLSTNGYKRKRGRGIV